MGVYGVGSRRSARSRVSFLKTDTPVTMRNRSRGEPTTGHPLENANRRKVRLIQRRQREINRLFEHELAAHCSVHHLIRIPDTPHARRAPDFLLRTVALLIEV